MNEFELVTLQSGVKSLRDLQSGETFHPVTGPWIEANVLHVEQQRIVQRAQSVPKFVIWDVGLGAAGNVLAAIEALKDVHSEIEVHSFDHSLTALGFALQNAPALEYLVPYQDILKELQVTRDVRPFPHIRWRLHLGDFGQALKTQVFPAPHAIFYDPYSPSRNVEMWTLEQFLLLKNTLHSETPFLLSNYTCSTAVRVTLLLAGFFVGQGSSIGLKLETTLASNCLELLENPLPRSWLRRVQASSNSAPLRAGAYTKLPISPDDLKRLESLPQFTPLTLS